MEKSQQNIGIQRWVAFVAIILFLLKLAAFYLTQSVAVLTDGYARDTDELILQRTPIACRAANRNRATSSSALISPVFARAKRRRRSIATGFRRHSVANRGG